MTKKQEVLNALWGKDWVSFSVLNRVCFRYGARIFELRKSGLDIQRKQEGGVQFYRLVTPRYKVDKTKGKLKEKYYGKEVTVKPSQDNIQAH